MGGTIRKCAGDHQEMLSLLGRKHFLMGGDHQEMRPPIRHFLIGGGPSRKALPDGGEPSGKALPDREDHQDSGGGPSGNACPDGGTIRKGVS